MTLPRFALRVSPAILLAALVLTTAPARAADTKWDPFRNTAPESVEELKALQNTVNAVTAKCTPFTVGILIGNASGSGVIVNSEGLVLTAGHVSGEPGRKCRIILPNGSRIEAKTLGYNKKMDSGMIQITAEAPAAGWPFAKLAKSRELKKDQWLVALGHPNGYKEGRAPVARLGQIKSLPGNLLSPDVRFNNLRTSCTLVGGDSGGPLFDLEGRLVGIHSQIGLSIYANIHVPVDEFKADWDQLLNAETVVRKPPTPAKPTVTLGVEYEDNDDEPPTLSKVEADGPAAEAGLRKGDIITKFDGEDITTMKELNAKLLKCKPDQEIELTVKRGKRKLTVTLTLAKL